MIHRAQAAPRKRRTHLLVLLLLIDMLALRGGNSVIAEQGPRLPPGFSASVIAEGLALPTDMELLPSGELLVSEKGAGKEAEGVSQVRLIRNGVLLPEPVLTLSTQVEKDSGILGLVVDPDFEHNRYFYVWYATGVHALRTGADPVYRLSRFTLDPTTARADASGETIVLDGVPWSSAHGGGGLDFDEQGNLYIATGDGRDRESAQDVRELSGKILRIRPQVEGYAVPDDNPFVGVADARSEVYALGLRNPFRMAGHSNGLAVVGDVGDEKWEEINRLAAAANYGWPEREGPCLRDKREPCGAAPPEFTDAVYYYLHDGGGAVTALAFYEGSAFPPQYHDVLFYADLDQAIISAVDLSGASPSAQPFASNMPGIVDLAYGNNGLYYLDIYRGQVGFLFYSGANSYAPMAALSAVTTFGPAPLTVHFSADGSTDPNGLGIHYHWDFGDGSIPVITTESGVSHRYTQDGTYTVRLQAINVLDENSSEVTEEIVVYSGEIPSIKLNNLTEPGRSQFYGDDRWSYQVERTGGTAGLDPDTPYQWRVDLHHNQHSHPLIAEQDVISDTIDLADSLHGGEWNLWFRFYLTTMTDTGQKFTLYEEIHPALSAIGFGSAPAGAEIQTDGVPYWTDHQAKAIVCTRHALDAGALMLVDQGVWEFDHWTTPAGVETERALQVTAHITATTYTAHYMYDRPAHRALLPVIMW